MLHNFMRKFKAFEMLTKGGHLPQNLLRELIRLNRSQIRLKTQDITTWRIPATREGTPGISIKSPYSVKIEAINPLEYVEHGETKAEMVKGYLYLQTDVGEDLPPEMKTAFQEDIEYCVQSESSSSRDYVQVKLSNEVIKGKNIFVAEFNSCDLIILNFRLSVDGRNRGGAGMEVGGGGAKVYMYISEFKLLHL